MDYLERLRESLGAMPEEERERIVEYYKNIIAQATDKDEMMASLGTPGEVAANILSEYIKKGGAKKRKKVSTGMIIAIIATSPIWFPVVIGILSAILALAVAVIAFGITGVALIVSSPFLLFSDFANGLLILGAALMIIGVVMLTFKPVVGLFRTVLSRIFFAISKTIRGVNNGGY